MRVYSVIWRRFSARLKALRRQTARRRVYEKTHYTLIPMARYFKAL